MINSTKHPAILVLCFLCAFTWAGGKKMRVQVLQATVKSEPKAWGGTTVGTLKLKDNVNMLEKKGTWARIETEDKKIKGWVRLSDLQSYNWISRFGKSDDNVRETTSAAESAKSARGFDKQTEAKYKSGNPQADYTWIDKIDSAAEFKVSMEDLKKFVADGKLEPKEDEK